MKNNSLDFLYATTVAMKEKTQKFRNVIGSGYRNVVGDVSTIDPNDNTYTFLVSLINATNAGTATLFGYAEDTTETTNTTNNVTVAVSESSHTLFKYKSSVNPFRLKGIAIETTTAAQLGNTLTFSYSTAGGATETRKWTPTSYKKESAYNSLLITHPDFSLPVDGFTKITFVQRANETQVRITVWIDSEVNPPNGLHGKSAISQATKGMPQKYEKVIVQNANRY